MGEDTLVEALKALAHPSRIAIMKALAQRECNVGEIEDMTGIGQPALSQQLAVLRKADLVATRRQAKLVYYRPEAGALDNIAAALAGLAPADASAGDSEERTPSPGVANFARLSC